MAEIAPPPKKPTAPRAPRKPAAIGGEAIEPLAADVAPVPQGIDAESASEPQAPSSGLKAKAGEAAQAVKQEALSLKDKAASSARDAAAQGKDKATGALDDLARAIDEVAGTIDERVGQQYGTYTRKAGSAISDFSQSLRTKEIDDIVRDAGTFVRKSPAIAIGAATAVGFILARLVKAGATDRDRL